MERDIPVRQIEPNPNQPRKQFPEEHIQSLAESIRRRGLIQSISVRQMAAERYIIVTGECRWRAHVLLKLETIRADVVDITDTEMKLRAIVENMQRREMNPIEEAMAFQSLIDEGYTWDRIVAELCLGSTAIVRNRINLLNLTPELQGMVASGQLQSAMADGVASVPKEYQSQLVRDIAAGRYRTAAEVRHAAIAIKNSDQVDAFADAPTASVADMAVIGRLEQKIDSIVEMVRNGFREGECVVAQRVAPDRVDKVLKKFALIRKHVLRMEHELRRAQVQASMREEIATVKRTKAIKAIGNRRVAALDVAEIAATRAPRASNGRQLEL